MIDAKAESTDSAARLLESAAAIFEAWSDGPKLTFLGDRSRTATNAEAAALIALTRRDWANGNPAPIVASDDPVAPSVLAVVEPADLFDRSFDRAWIRPAPVDRGRPSQAVRQLFKALGSIEDLVGASVRHELLATLFYARASAAKAFEATPESLRAYLPPVLVPAWGLADPGLVLPDGALALRLPEAVWNANLFGPGQVEHLGSQSLLKADWNVVETLPSGAVFAQATAEPPQAMNAETAGSILHIIGQLRLPTLQRSLGFTQDGAR